MHKRQKETVRRAVILEICLLFALLLLFASSALAADTPQSRENVADWSLMTGYGSSHPGWGETETTLETIDLIFRRNIMVKEHIGSSWYQGYHSLFIELPFHYLPDYPEDPMVGLSFLAAYTFTSWQWRQWRPYLMAGGGPLYVGAHIPGMGTHWNGHYLAGVGISVPINESNRAFFEVRYHHVSNGGTNDPNIPLNSTKFLLGVTF